MRFFLLATTALLALEGAAYAQSQEGFVNRPDAAHLRVEDAGTAVFRSRAEWLAFWIDHHEGRFHAPPHRGRLPEVDFERRMLVAVFWGRLSGCGGGAKPVERVEGVEREGETLVVRLAPLGSMGVCRAWAAPLQVIDVDRADGGVRVEGAGPWE